MLPPELINDPYMSTRNSLGFNIPDWTITTMIVMDCLHFANYFVLLIYNSKLLQSALKA